MHAFLMDLLLIAGVGLGLLTVIFAVLFVLVLDDEESGINPFM